LLLPDSTPATSPLLDPGTAFELRVTLRGADPPIWRRFRVSAEIRLPALHRVLQRVMGWQNSHLHEFVAGGVSFGEPVEEDNYGPIDERRIRLSQLIRRPGDLIT
jgi:Plasmid pRiA4b ORF-3-like protein